MLYFYTFFIEFLLFLMLKNGTNIFNNNNILIVINLFILFIYKL